MRRMLVTATAAMALSGCASIIDVGETPPVTVKSVPDSSSISVTNRAGEKIHATKTAVTLTLNRSPGQVRSETYAVRVEKAGYQSRHLSISGTASGWTIGNIVFGGPIGMLIVDPLTGELYKLTPDTVDVSLDSAELKSSFKADGTLTIALAQDVPEKLWKYAKLIQAN